MSAEEIYTALFGLIVVAGLYDLLAIQRRHERALSDLRREVSELHGQLGRVIRSLNSIDSGIARLNPRHDDWREPPI